MHSQDPTRQNPPETTKTLVENLCVTLENEGSPVKVIETHISHILLSGNHAYKIKKPVDLGFINFTNVDKRHFYCQEELRLNRRLAPEFYIEVVPITGAVENPSIAGRGTTIDYAVKMLRFDESKQLDRLIATDELTPAQLDSLALDLAVFHQNAGVADVSSIFSTPEVLRKRAMQNFEALATHDEAVVRSGLDRLKHWTEASLVSLEEEFYQRREQGHVRECHGDLHLGNMFLDKDHIVVFDCLEYDESFRWIDVMSDIAFLMMDLDYSGRKDLSHNLLNKYLEHTGDYQGLEVLTHYLVYRALVRAKVASIRHRQTSAKRELPAGRSEEVEDHITLALKYTQTHLPTPLIITHGVSGSGKSYVSKKLAESINAIHIRSDVERKRIPVPGKEIEHGLNLGAYTSDMTRKTYARLLKVAKEILHSGHPVLVDATFLTIDQRSPFQHLATELKVPYKILDVEAPYTVLRERINQRRKDGNDPSEASLDVLDNQLTLEEAPTLGELSATVVIDTNKTMDIVGLSKRLTSPD